MIYIMPQFIWSICKIVEWEKVKTLLREIRVDSCFVNGRLSLMGCNNVGDLEDKENLIW